MQIVTLLKSGGRFDSRHVSCLYAGCRKWIRGYCDFVCLTDLDPILLSRSIDPSVRCVPLVHDWPGWWGKMEVFRTDYNPKNMEISTLYVDLDTIFCNYINPIFDIESSLVLLSENSNINPSIFYKTSNADVYSRELFEFVSSYIRDHGITIENYKNEEVPNVEDFIQKAVNDIGLDYTTFDKEVPGAVLFYPKDKTKIPYSERINPIPPGKKCIVAFSRGYYPENIGDSPKWLESNYQQHGRQNRFERVWSEKR